MNPPGRSVHRIAVFVDAGYLFAGGGQLLTGGTRLSRGQLWLEIDDCLQRLTDLAQELSGAQLLRIYWYDGSGSGPTTQHTALSFRDNLKLRLGTVNDRGQQRGVDLLLVSDLIELSRNGAITDALVLTGDEDIRVGVLLAQQQGVRVHLLGVDAPQGKWNNQSTLLRQEADTTSSFSREQLAGFLRVSDRYSDESDGGNGNDNDNDDPISADVRDVIRRVVNAEVEVLGYEQLAAAVEGDSGREVAPEMDRQLLLRMAHALNRDLTFLEKHRLRSAFVASVKNVLASGADELD